MTDAAARWFEQNRKYLLTSIARVRKALEQAGRRDAGGRDKGAVGAGGAAGRVKPAKRRVRTKTHPTALEVLCGQFGLSEFERDVLLLAAGMEIDPAMPAASAAASGHADLVRPSVGLALAALPKAHWSAFSSGAPLRKWRLLELGAGDQFTARTLRIDERILLYLIGVNDLDGRLRGSLLPLRAPAAPSPSRIALAQRMSAVWTVGSYPQEQVLLLSGSAGSARNEVAALLCQRLGVPGYRMRAALLPSNAFDTEQLAQLISREALLSAFVLVLDCEDAADWDAGRVALVQQFIESARTPLVVELHKASFAFQRDSVRFEAQRLTRKEQRHIWDEYLPQGAASEEELDQITFQFVLERPGIQAAALEATSQKAASGVWNACRLQARPSLDDVAERIEWHADWDDLVLPAAEKETLRAIVLHVRERFTVYGAWGFGERRPAGLGISAMFAGPSGTGKTLAAEVLARHLSLDLFRIDLSAIISKYIGETEKNLRRVFDAAERGGAVLVFDEADALFGKRTEVKDSHDRYANIEVSYLLQKIESYQGLAILTTNHREAIDTAFLRRLRFIVNFPFPGPEQREEIWKHIFPARTPTASLDYRRLAQLNVSGGSIQNIAMGAAFVAAADQHSVGMADVLAAAKLEYQKNEKNLSNLELEGWSSSG